MQALVTYISWRSREELTGSHRWTVSCGGWRAEEPEGGTLSQSLGFFWPGSSFNGWRRQCWGVNPDLLMCCPSLAWAG